MRIAICDDELCETMKLSQTIHSLFIEAKRPVPSIRLFTSAEELLENVEKEKNTFNLIFFDIFMPGLGGLEAAKRLQQTFPHTNFVFVTTSREFAVQAFNLRALHYLVKPIDKESVAEAIRRYDASIFKPRVEIKSTLGEISVLLENIQIIQSKRNLLLIQTAQNEIVTRIPMKEFARKLNEDFILLSRGVMVNMSFISKMNHDSCELMDGQTILISRSSRTEIRNRYNDYIFNQMNRT